MNHDMTGRTAIQVHRFRPTSERFLPDPALASGLLATLPSTSGWDREARLLVNAAGNINANGEGDGADVLLALKITQRFKDVFETKSDELREISDPHLQAFKFGMDVLIYHGYVLLPEDLDDEGNPRGEDITRYISMPTGLESVLRHSSGTAGNPSEVKKATPEKMLAGRALVLGWAPLTGTPKQVAWAAKIRDRALARQDADLGRALTRAHPDARWWIEHRDSLPRHDE